MLDTDTDNKVKQILRLRPTFRDAFFFLETIQIQYFHFCRDMLGTKYREGQGLLMLKVP